MLIGWAAIAALLSARLKPSAIEGTLAGLLTALLSLLALGSILVEQPDPSAFAEGQAPLRPAAALIILGFLLVGAAVGALASLASGRRSSEPDIRVGPDPWPCRLAIAVAAAYVPLVLLGGAVTSTESGMAVRGWPDTFGANMFLYPISLMSQPRVYLEHSHRLFGTLAGMATILFWLMTLVSHETRRRFGVWTTILFLAVCLQGYLGGERVVQNNPYLGAARGIRADRDRVCPPLAPGRAPSYMGVPPISAPKSARLRRFASIALAASLLQLLLGAMYRHLRRGDNPGASHVVMTHAAFSLSSSRWRSSPGRC
ncbi:MAG: COX15/CtaA family protein [Phycisphaerales bacterium]|nr:COX15/CtaA family protein [Phycisphaerales bacterium]